MSYDQADDFLVSCDEDENHEGLVGRSKNKGLHEFKDVYEPLKSGHTKEDFLDY